MQWRARNILRLRDETATLNKDLSPGLRPGLFYLLKDYIFKSNRCLLAAFLRPRRAPHGRPKARGPLGGQRMTDREAGWRERGGCF